MRNLHTYEASDYAGIDIPSKGIRLYYGYEVIDREDNWCFEATFPRGGVVIPFPEMYEVDGTLDQGGCTHCLLTGIAMLIERGDLIL